MPGLWMLRNSHSPSGLNVAPANSLRRKSPVMPLRSPFRTTLLRAKRTICAVARQAVHAGVRRAVFAQHQPAARAHRQVVGHVQHVVRLVTRRPGGAPGSGCRAPRPDPSCALPPSVLVTKMRPAGVPHALEPAEQRAAAFVALREHADAVPLVRIRMDPLRLVMSTQSIG